MNDFAIEITSITYKEIMIFWNVSERAAALRLNTIRKMLNKTRFHRVTVDQFCQVEDITVQEFRTRINEYYSTLSHKKAS